MTSFPLRPDEPSAGLVVRGGGPAGHSAAAAHRKHGGQGRVLVISADGDAPYQRPRLSKDFLRRDATPERRAALSEHLFGNLLRTAIVD